MGSESLKNPNWLWRDKPSPELSAFRKSPERRALYQNFRNEHIANEKSLEYPFHVPYWILDDNKYYKFHFEWTRVKFGKLATDYPSPADNADAMTRQECIKVALSRLTKRERYVLKARYGDDHPPIPLRTIAAHWGVTLQRIRQIELKAMRRIKPILARLLEIEYDGLTRI